MASLKINYNKDVEWISVADIEFIDEGLSRNGDSGNLAINNSLRVKLIQN